jgi:hypothetical protein
LLLQSLSVGIQDGEDNSRIWFKRWLLELGEFNAPACIWRVEERDNGVKVVTQTYKDTYKRPSGLPNPPQRLWVLKDNWRNDASTGCGDPMCLADWTQRLGVWPD